MRIDITSMFFNSKIEGKTATAAWGTSIGQNKSRGCRVDDYKQDVVDMIIGMTYKGISDWDNLDVSKGSSDRDIIKCAVFDDVYINNNKVDDAQYVLLLVREHSSSHEGRLLISYAPYITYKGIPNQDCIDLMQSLIGCTSDGCWFVYDISIKNQSELHFSAVVVNNTSPMVYKGTSKDRSEAWRAMIPSDDKGRKILSSPLQTIFYGTPGSGKSHKVKGIVEEKYPNMEEQENFVFRTTFHPDSDYASFVGCYKPVMEGDVIKYKFTPQAFTKAYVTAWENQEQAVYLIIEEINRGNCAQIFGDLFQLLDRKDGVSEYPIDADNDLKDYLEKELGVGHDGIANGKLRLPSNLNILATMNTSDQSLFPMDSAFKRRWSWKCVPVDYNNPDSEKFTIKIGDDKEYNWHKFLKIINKKIKDITDSEDKQMGNFFITDNIDKDQFVDKVMFYLWNDIFKEEYNTNRNHFRYKKNGSDEETVQFSFNDLFSKDLTNMLIGFMEYIMSFDESSETGI